MSRINGLGNTNPLHQVTGQPVRKEVPADAPKQLPVTDKLELSGLSHLLKSLKTNDIRAEKVAQIKAALDAGAYEDEKKLDAAIDRLLDDLLK